MSPSSPNDAPRAGAKRCCACGRSSLLVLVAVAGMISLVVQSLGPIQIRHHRHLYNTAWNFIFDSNSDSGDDGNPALALVGSCVVPEQPSYTDEEVKLFFPDFTRKLSDCKLQFDNISFVVQSDLHQSGTGASSGDITTNVVMVKCNSSSEAGVAGYKTPPRNQQIPIEERIAWSYASDSSTNAARTDFRWFRFEVGARDEIILTKCGSQVQAHLRAVVRPELSLSRYQLRQRVLARADYRVRNTNNGSDDSIAAKAVEAAASESVLGRNPLIVHINYDSVSRAHWLRTMQKTTEFLHHLENDHAMYDFQLHNVLGDSTHANMGPYMNYQAKDKSPSLFRTFSSAGFVTAFVQDDCRSGLAPGHTLRGNPADHTPNQFWCLAREHPFYYLKNYHGLSDTRCLGNQPSNEHALNYVRSFIDEYSNNARFVFAHLSDGHEMSGRVLKSADEPLREFMRDILASNPNAFVVLSSDHGMRYGGWRRSEGGFLEHKLPPLYIVASPNLVSRAPKNFEMLSINQYRLSTKRDLAQTLRHLIVLRRSLRRDPAPLSNEQSQKTPADLSLLEEIPQNRSCASAGIRADYCSCLPWVDIPLEEVNATSILGFPSTAELMKRFVSSINAMIPRPASDYCLRLNDDGEALGIAMQPIDNSGTRWRHNLRLRFTTRTPMLVEWDAIMAITVYMDEADALQKDFEYDIPLEQGFPREKGTFALERFNILFVNRPSAWPKDCTLRAIDDGVDAKYCVCAPT